MKFAAVDRWRAAATISIAATRATRGMKRVRLLCALALALAIGVAATAADNDDDDVVTFGVTLTETGGTNKGKKHQEMMVMRKGEVPSVVSFFFCAQHGLVSADNVLNLGQELRRQAIAKAHARAAKAKLDAIELEVDTGGSVTAAAAAADPEPPPASDDEAERRRASARLQFEAGRVIEAGLEMARAYLHRAGNTARADADAAAVAEDKNILRVAVESAALARKGRVLFDAERYDDAAEALENALQKHGRDRATGALRLDAPPPKGVKPLPGAARTVADGVDAKEDAAEEGAKEGAKEDAGEANAAAAQDGDGDGEGEGGGEGEGEGEGAGEEAGAAVSAPRGTAQLLHLLALARARLGQWPAVLQGCSRLLTATSARGSWREGQCRLACVGLGARAGRELADLNTSKKFYSIVLRADPDCRNCGAWLKKEYRATKKVAKHVKTAKKLLGQSRNHKGLAELDAARELFASSCGATTSQIFPAKLLIQACNAKSLMKRHEEALIDCDKAVDIVWHQNVTGLFLNPAEQADILETRANAHMRDNNFDEAVRDYFQSLDILESTGDADRKREVGQKKWQAERKAKEWKNLARLNIISTAEHFFA